MTETLRAAIAHHYASDACFATRALEVPDRELYVLIQGIGEPRLAHRCADATLETFTDVLTPQRPTSRAEVETALREATQSAQRRLLADLAGSEHVGTGATIVAFWRVRDGVVIGHLGQCRAYRRRGTAWERLTDDHSTLFEFCRWRGVAPEALEDWPRQYRNQIQRGLGFVDPVELDVQVRSIEPGDLFILATDRLQARLEHDELAGLIPDVEAAPHTVAAELVGALRGLGPAAESPPVTRNEPAAGTAHDTSSDVSIAVIRV